MKLQTSIFPLLFSIQISVFSQTFIVTTNADSGTGSLRQAITDINNGSDSSNTINLRIPGNSTIFLSSDLPVVKKNTAINSTNKQTINGNGQYRLFATIMSDLSLTNCKLHNGAAIGGNGAAGGMGAGGGVYIDRGNTLTLKNCEITSCKAQGGKCNNFRSGGGGASFSTLNKHATLESGGGDYPGNRETGGQFDGSSFLVGYGGGDGGTSYGSEKQGKGGGNNAGQSYSDSYYSKGGDGGYCGGGGSNFSGGGGNGGGNGTYANSGGGGFGSGGGRNNQTSRGGGGGFGGGGGADAPAGGGGFGGGGGDSETATGGRYGGSVGGGGGGLGGALFIGDSANMTIEDSLILSDNQAIGGEGENPGEGYAPDIFLFQKAEVYFNNEQPLIAPFSIQADLQAPSGHLDSGIIKQGSGLLMLSNIRNNYRGGTEIQEGMLSIPDPRVLGSSKGPIILSGGSLQPTNSMSLENPIKTNSSRNISICTCTCTCICSCTCDEITSPEFTSNNSGGEIDIPKGIILTTTGKISGSGIITKTNAGTWKQKNTSTHTGNLNINQGTVEIHGTLPSSIYISPGAILQGTGTAGGKVTNSGTLSPGDNYVGSLTILGNYIQKPNGLLKFQMSPKGQNNKLIVLGSAQIDGEIDVQLMPGIYTKNQKYNLIDCEGSINGLFDEPLFSLEFLGNPQFTNNKLNMTFLESRIILPIPSNQLPKNQKKLANYLFCDNLPFENTDLVDILQNLFQLSIPEYSKALATLTPEHYGALPIGESRCVAYLLARNQSFCEKESVRSHYSITVLPLYYKNNIDRKHYHLPNYEQNTGGFRIEYSMCNPKNISLDIAGSYLHTYTKWENQLGSADSNGGYFDTKLNYKKSNLYCSLGVLAGYSNVSARRNIYIGYPIKAQSNPNYCNIAEVLSAEYSAKCKCIAVIPKVNITQTNVFLSSICENEPKELNLQTESKYFRFLDTLLSIKIQLETQAICNCIKAYVDLGWHSINQLCSRNFYSTVNNYTACSNSFATQTYNGSIRRYFMEWGGTISYCPSFGLFLNYKTEVTKGDKIQGLNFGAHWMF